MNKPSTNGTTTYGRGRAHTALCGSEIPAAQRQETTKRGAGLRRGGTALCGSEIPAAQRQETTKRGAGLRRGGRAQCSDSCVCGTHQAV